MALLGVGLLAAAALAWAIVAQTTTAGTTVVTVQNYAAATFTAVEDSSHNRMGGTVCADFVPSQQGAENRGDLDAKQGSFLQDVQLPQGATVRQLALWANDNDGDGDVHAFLIRKRIEPGLSPQFQGYGVMARARSQGAVLNTMRKFRDNTIAGATVDNTRFFYFIELVNCATVEPFAVQVAYTR